MLIPKNPLSGPSPQVQLPTNSFVDDEGAIFAKFLE